MSEICKECGSSIAELTVDEAGKFLLNKASMWTWEEMPVGHKSEVFGLGEVEVVFNSYLDSEGGPIMMVWNTRIGYVANKGSYNSYDGSDWDNRFVKAERNTKEVVYFE